MQVGAKEFRYKIAAQFVKLSFNPSLLENLHVFKRGNEYVTERNDLSICK
jgi:hypothetical protein